MASSLDFTPTQPCQWTRWDHLVFAVTGMVSRRVYEDQRAVLARDDVRVRVLTDQIRREPVGEGTR